MRRTKKRQRVKSHKQQLKVSLKDFLGIGLLDGKLKHDSSASSVFLLKDALNVRILNSKY